MGFCHMKEPQTKPHSPNWSIAPHLFLRLSSFLLLSSSLLLATGLFSHLLVALGAKEVVFFPSLFSS